TSQKPFVVYFRWVRGSVINESTPSWLTTMFGLNFLSSDGTTSSKAYTKSSSSEEGGIGIFTEYPLPSPSPISVSNPVPGNRYKPDSWSDIVSTLSVR